MTVKIGTITYETYQTVPEVDAFLQADAARAPKWAALTADGKARCVVTATRRFNRLEWVGQKTDPEDELAWPRTGTGVEGVVDDDIPQAVLDAHATFAGDLAGDVTVADKPNTGSNVRSVKAGSAQVEFFTPTTGSVLPPTILDLIGDLLAGSVTAGTLTAPYASDTCGVSEFQTPNRFGRSSGFP